MNMIGFNQMDRYQESTYDIESKTIGLLNQFPSHPLENIECVHARAC